MKAIKELLIARATFLSSPMWEPIYAPLPWDNLTTQHKPISPSLTQTNGEISRDRASEQSLWLGCQRQIWCTLSFPFLQKVLLISLFLHCYIVFFFGLIHKRYVYNRVWCWLCRDNGDNDVTVKILYCGVCHTDLHTIKNDWGFSYYPVVPG